MAKKKSSGVFIYILIISTIIVVLPRDKKEQIFDTTKEYFSITDPGVRVELFSDSHYYKEIKTYKSDVFSNGLILYKGNKESFGFAHILARHTTEYFEDYDKATTLFPESLSARELIKSINYFVKHCVRVYGVNRKPDEYETYLGYIKLDNDSLLRCLMVVDPKRNSIVTFYPFGEEEEETFYRQRRNTYSYTYGYEEEILNYD